MSPVTAATPQDSLDSLAEMVIGTLKAAKDAGAATGDRNVQARAVAELKLFELIRDTERLVGTIGRWVGALTMEDRLVRGSSSAVREGFAGYVQKLSFWRHMKQGPDVVRDFAQDRIDLAERIKATVPKEASAWALAELAERKDLSIYLPELVRSDALFSFTQFIAEEKYRMVQTLAKEIEKLDNMDAWTTEQTADALIGMQYFREFVVSEMYAILVKIYIMAFSTYWLFINTNEQVDFDELDEVEGLCRTPEVDNCQCEYCKKGISFRQSPADRIEWLDKTAGAAVVNSKVWGAHEPFIQAISKLDIQSRSRVLWAIGGTAAKLWDTCRELVEERRLKDVALKDLNKEKKRGEKEVSQLKIQVAGMHRQIEEMRAARARRGGDQPQGDTSHLEEELKQSKKTVELLRADLAKKEEERARTGELLRSVLSAVDEGEEEETRAVASMPAADLRQMRGVVIGGHNNLLAKLRKELPNCVFYSADAKTVDEDAVRNSTFILFIAGYVNHCLTGHALRLSRLYSIPCGYTDRTNVNLVLEDVTAALESGA